MVAQRGLHLRRGGSTPSRVFLEGEPVHMRRPRVRDHALGTEHPLQTVAALSSRDTLDEDVQRLIARGVTTRNYDAALGRISDGLGLKKSALVYIDGLGFGDTTCVVAMGVSIDGSKRILGVRDGASENSTVVVDLLDSLEVRGLVLTSRALFVLDGGKAPRKAINAKDGERALVQRCHVHKIRNVLAYLPPSEHAEARRRLLVAWGMERHEDTEAELRRTLAWLRSLSASAAESLEEAFDETLTVYSVGVGASLRRSLVTTNPIESAFDTVRAISRRVKRWRDATMALRWAGTGLIKARSQFGRLKGYRPMGALVAALESDPLKSTKVVACFIPAPGQNEQGAGYPHPNLHRNLSAARGNSGWCDNGLPDRCRRGSLGVTSHPTTRRARAPRAGSRTRSQNAASGATFPQRAASGRASSPGRRTRAP